MVGRVGARSLSVVVVVGLLVLGVGLAPTAPSQAAPTPFSAHGSVNQVYVVDLQPGGSVELRDASDDVVATATADSQGSALFRTVPAGDGYQVRQGADTSDPLTVTAPDDHPDAAFYEGITVAEGYGYVPTRDGTTLNINVNFPVDGSTGPWPVVIDYSGYDPGQPGLPPPEALAFLAQGYVVVGVNMRGTGCSGGAFDYFEPLQSLDGYDVVEAVARQSWSNGDVGLVGISYPGISQLFVAQTRPPHLRAITPLSVIADTYRSTLYPGGILNSGFALGWAKDRVDGAKPAAHQWVRDRIAGGDQTCAANQKLKLQARDLLAEIRPDRFYEAAGDALAPRTFVDRIDVPVYLSGQFQDEQTGGHFSTMVPDFTSAPVLKVTLTNGTHVEPLGPEQFVRLLEFVDFYVGKRTPHVSPIVRAAIPDALGGVFGISGITLPPDRFDGYPSYEAAKAAYEAEPSVRVLWENGGGAAPGAPYSTAETAYDSWPVPGAGERSWYLQPDGRLADDPATVADDEPRGSSSYVFDASTKRSSTFDGSTEDIWKTNPDVHWEPLDEGSALSFATEPFAEQTAMAGWGSVDLWLRSEAADTDLEVTITEVRPDGQERFIQSGWLRASHRALDPSESTSLLPFPTHLEADARPLPEGEYVPARVALFPFAYVVRAGSRLRLNIEAPGGNQPFWEFDTSGTPQGVRNDVAHSAGRPSKVVLPVLGAADSPHVPAQAPPCPSLRNEPCRDYLPARVPTDVTLTQDGADRFEVSWTAPERGGPPDHYLVEVSSGDDLAELARLTAVVAPVEVAGDVTTASFAAEPGVPYVATVRAVYDDGAAPASNASLAATLQVDDPTTTTSNTTSTTATTSGDEVAADVATSDTGTLPLTGAQILVLAMLGLAVLLGGAAAVAVSRRGTGPRAGAP